MNVRDVMTSDPATCRRDTSLRDVARMMVECDCGAIPVVDEGQKPLGVITDRDMVVRLIANGRNPIECTAQDAMTGDPLCVRPDESVEDTSEKLEDRKVRRAIVVDESGKVCGILAQADIAKRDEDLAGELVQSVSQPTAH
ncbi:MAG TPA: CBS domain-containing protein [Anaeromyxobacteraceae bacterium]|nr:CBS domain-containing protein [Anaeromyxobacteraceae bacterium]